MGKVGLNLVQVNDAAAIDRPSGLDAQGRVTLGKNPPISLKDVASYSIPFLGFKHATRVSNEMAGIQSSLRRAVNALAVGGAASFDAKALLKSLETLRQYTLKLRSTQNGEVDLEKTVMDAMKDLVKSLSNSEMQALYDQLLTADMEDLKQAMSYQARTSTSQRTKMVFALDALATLEAVAVSDVSRRIVDDANDTIALETGMNLAATGEKKAEAAEAERRSERDTMKQVGDKPVTARDIGDKMRSAELIMNVPVSLLFGSFINDVLQPKFNADGEIVDTGDSLPVVDPGFQFRNSVQLAEDRQSAGGAANPPRESGNDDYNDVRKAVENSLFPELAERNGAGADRPIYAALNINERLDGNSRLYGGATIVFKDHVKKSATYTYGDSFESARILTGESAKQRFIGELEKIELLTEEGRAALRDPATEVRKSIDRIFTGVTRQFSAILSSDDFVSLKSALEMLFRDDARLGVNGCFHIVQNALAKAALDKTAQRDAPVTFGNLEALVPKMSVPEQVRLEAYAAGLLKRPCLRGQQYIEAQLSHHPDFRSDIAEIRVEISDKDADGNPMTEDKYRKVEARFAAWSRATGVKVVPLRPGVVSASDHDLETEDAFFNASFDRNYGMTDHIRHLAETEVEAVMGDRAALSAFFRAADPDGKIAALVGGDYLDPETSSYARDLAAKWGDALVEIYKDEDEIRPEHIKDALKETFESAFAKKKEILRIIADELEFDSPAAKVEFAKWALACKVKEPGELRLVHAGVRKMNALVADIAAGRIVGAAATGKALRTLLDEFADMEAKLGETMEYGPDDSGANHARIGSLAADLLGVSAVSGETKRVILSAFTSYEMNNAFNIAAQAVGEYDNGGMDLPDGDLSKDILQANTFAFTVDAFRQRLARRLGAPAPQGLHDKGVALKDLPSADRRAFAEIFPALGADLAGRVPPAPERPLPPPMAAPADPALRTGRLSDRRAFLLKALPGYHKNELLDEDGEANFDRGRDFHGRTHATRVFIYANVLANILKKHGVKVDTDAVARLAAGHDIGRVKNGPDEDENKSAQITAGLVGPSAGQAHLDGIAKAITFGDKSTPPSTEAFVLHCADTLDHARVGDFDMEKFPFLRECLVLPDGTTVKIDPGLREQLVKEAKLLIRLTHPGANVQFNASEGKYLLPNGEMDDERYIADLNSAERLIELRSDTVDDEKLVTQIENLVTGENDIEPIPTNRLFPLLSQFYRD